MAQECLLGKHKVPSSNPSTVKKKKMLYPSEDESKRSIKQIS
jgi:hypothetical protein